jgi:hypothetical protein
MWWNIDVVLILQQNSMHDMAFRLRLAVISLAFKSCSGTVYCTFLRCRYSRVESGCMKLYSRYQMGYITLLVTTFIKISAPVTPGRHC